VRPQRAENAKPVSDQRGLKKLEFLKFRWRDMVCA
jgi:hypothetical protein